jgi:hypothetical protein
VRRDRSILIVVENVADLWALERAGVANGQYHVLGGTLSPLDGVGPGDLNIEKLIARAHEAEVKEVILALNATVDGQTTAHYITDLLRDSDVKVTRLATACRSAANSIISTKARVRRRCAHARRSRISDQGSRNARAAAARRAETGSGSRKAR